MTTVFIYLQDNMKYISKMLQIDSIYIDFVKTFDSVDHHHLINKLKNLVNKILLK